MASDQESCSDEEPDSEMLSDDLCLPDSDDDSRQPRTIQVRCEVEIKTWRRGDARGITRPRVHLNARHKTSISNFEA